MQRSRRLVWLVAMFVASVVAAGCSNPSNGAVEEASIGTEHAEVLGVLPFFERVTISPTGTHVLGPGDDGNPLLIAVDDPSNAIALPSLLFDNAGFANNGSGVVGLNIAQETLVSFNLDGTEADVLFSPQSLPAASLRSAQLSPDQSQVALYAPDPDDDSNVQLVLANTADGSTRTLGDVPPSGGSQIRWSPDGASLAFTADEGLFIGDIEANAVNRLDLDPEFEGAPSWSPDGRQVAALAQSGDLVFVVDLDDALSVREFEDLEDGGTTPFPFFWLSSGDEFLVAISSDFGPVGYLLVDEATGAAEPLDVLLDGEPAAEIVAIGNAIPGPDNTVWVVVATEEGNTLRAIPN